MEETDNLRLPYLMAAQAQKHVTHNEALRSLDAIVQLAVEDRDLTGPPLTPADGARYLVGSPATGDWSGREGDIAAYQDGTWMFHTPREGWIAWISDENAAVVYDGTAWATLSSGGGGSVNPTPLVGINATADTTNRISVSAPASLLSHEGAGHRLKINKAALTDTASLLYQTAFSGRAELGLAGDDDFHFKVSGDGTNWNEAIVIDNATGSVTFPNTNLGGGAGVNPNILLNGDFQTNQRVFAGGALSAGDYGFDRWKAATGGANLSLSGFTVTLSSGEIEQVVEPAVWGLASFASQDVTVSVEAPSQDLSITFGSQSATISAGSGRQSATLALGAGDTGNLSFKLKRASGSGVTFGRVKLEVASTATGWVARGAATELLACQRYCVVYGNDGSVSYAQLAAGFCFNATLAVANFTFPLPMRVPPSVAWGGSLVGFVAGNGTAKSVTLSTIYMAATGGKFNVSSTGLTTGIGFSLNIDNTTAGRIIFDAEL